MPNQDRYDPPIDITVDQILSLYPNNAPVDIHTLWTHHTTHYEYASQVPRLMRKRKVYAFNGHPYTNQKSDNGITITVDMGELRPSDVRTSHE